jgi:Lar family restriction alleviation protein
MNKNLNEYQIERQKLSKELKSCPFCGGEARLRKHQKLEQTWYVQCKDCGIRTANSVQAPYESWKDTMKHPVDQWNSRI